MKILHLTLKRKWFDMILSGEKKEEYREFKDYWLKRLSNFFDGEGASLSNLRFKKYDTICFRHGYAKDAPTILIKCEGMWVGIPRPEWSGGALGTHIVIALGDIISTSNIQAVEP